MHSLKRLMVLTLMTGLLGVMAPAANAASIWRIPDPREQGLIGFNIEETTLDVQKRGYYRVRIHGYESCANG